jgi:hypothetical protein
MTANLPISSSVIANSITCLHPAMMPFLVQSNPNGESTNKSPVPCLPVSWNRSSSIHFVEPSVISACAEEVTFLIYGANIWRSAEVFLGGARGYDIKVLPDMEGISATFRLTDFYKTRNEHANPLGYEQVVLRVNTRNGKDWRPITIAGSRTTGSKPGSVASTCAAPYSVPTPIVRRHNAPTPTIFTLAPARIEACIDPIQIFVTGRDLMSPAVDQSGLRILEEPRVLLGGSIGSVKLISKDEEVGALQVLAVSFPRLQERTVGAGNLELIMINRGGFATASIQADVCKATSAGAGKMDAVSPAAATTLQDR